MEKITLSFLLRKNRIEKGLTQDEMAQELNVSRPYYNQLESGKRTNTRVGLAKKIADICGVNVLDIYKRG